VLASATANHGTMTAHLLIGLPHTSTGHLSQVTVELLSWYRHTAVGVFVEGGIMHCSSARTHRQVIGSRMRLISNFVMTRLA
jgi:hypothetical protein